MSSTLLVRPWPSRRMAIACWVACALVVVAVFVNGGFAELAAYGPVALAGAALAWAVFWEPHVRVDADGVDLANVWRTVTIPWGALESVDTRWGLRLVTTTKRYSSWAVPARSRYRRPRPDEPTPDLLDLPPETGQTVSANSEEVGRVIETRLLAGAGGGETATVTARANARSIGLVLGSAALAASTIALFG
ncbi:PH domain-containing protein [Georgenia deserti]|uniref:PH domain-containing protein n=1 Tax=Georgenia deserti TaxID=2093781 RepID=A0ABW4L520_9MICO